MFQFLKSKKDTDQNHTDQQRDNKPQSWLSRLNHGLKRTRRQFTDGLATIIHGKKVIDQALLDDLETRLLTADIGIEATQTILTTLTEQIDRKELNDPEALLTSLQQQLINLLTPCEQPLTMEQIGQNQPFVILMVGVNGAGKTTSIAKLAHHFQQQGKQVMLAAGDTFRAAAVEQLQVWGERHNVPVIAQHAGADSASVIYDAMEAATARGIDVLIADTAGRLHTQEHLMRELEKIKRVMGKINPEAPQEVMLVCDATIGQNALNQAKQFNECVNLTGITVTKLDGTAKGGIMVAIAQALQLPIRFIGVGEQADDLKPFVADEFVQALFMETAMTEEDE